MTRTYFLYEMMMKPLYYMKYWAGRLWS